MKILAVIMLMLAGIAAQGQQTRLENLHGKTVLVFTPHPDDDVFGAGGTIALLNHNQNKLYIVIYTNDDKGSYDLEMTSQHLAQIRKAEEEVSEGLLGTPKENIMWRRQQPLSGASVLMYYSVWIPASGMSDGTNRPSHGGF